MIKKAAPIKPQDMQFPYGELFPKGFFAPDVESNPFTPNILTRPVPSEEPRKEEEEEVLRLSPEDLTPVKPEISTKTGRPKRELYVLQTFAPSLAIDQYFPSEEKQGNMDGSFMILEYLKSVGYSDVSWIRGPEFKHDNCHKVNGWPICTTNLGLRTTIETLLSEAIMHAGVKGYSPPKPIIYLSHPNCGCSLRVYAPRGESEIPDNAPGIPMHASDEIKNNYKRLLFLKLKDLKINRWSTLSQADLDKYIRSYKLPFVYKTKDTKKDVQERELLKELEGDIHEYASYNPWIKTAEEDSDWVEDIRPVGLVDDSLYFQEPFILQPIPKTYIGFQLEKTENKSRVFLTNLGYEIELPKNLINYLELKPSKMEPDANMFIDIDGELAVIIAYEEYEKSLCYIPAFKDFVFLDGDFTTLEIAGY